MTGFTAVGPFVPDYCPEKSRALHGAPLLPLGIQLGLEAGVGLLEGLVVRKPGQLEAGDVAATLQDADLGLEGEVEELAVAGLPGLGAVDELVGGVGDSVLLAQVLSPLPDSEVRRRSLDRYQEAIDRELISERIKRNAPRTQALRLKGHPGAQTWMVRGDRVLAPGEYWATCAG